MMWKSIEIELSSGVGAELKICETINVAPSMLSRFFAKRNVAADIVEVKLQDGLKAVKDINGILHICSNNTVISQEVESSKEGDNTFTCEEVKMINKYPKIGYTNGKVYAIRLFMQPTTASHIYRYPYNPLEMQLPRIIYDSQKIVLEKIGDDKYKASIVC